MKWNWTIFLRGLYISLALPAISLTYFANCAGGIPFPPTEFNLLFTFFSYASFGVLISIFFMWRTTPANTCGCGYNLTGNTSGVCPECGTPIEDDTP